MFVYLLGYFFFRNYISVRIILSDHTLLYGLTRGRSLDLLCRLLRLRVLTCLLLVILIVVILLLLPLLSALLLFFGP